MTKNTELGWIYRLEKRELAFTLPENRGPDGPADIELQSILDKQKSLPESKQLQVNTEASINLKPVLDREIERRNTDFSINNSILEKKRGEYR